MVFDSERRRSKYCSDYLYWILELVMGFDRFFIAELVVIEVEVCIQDSQNRVGVFFWCVKSGAVNPEQTKIFPRQ
jgi:hypothetical protein